MNENIFDKLDFGPLRSLLDNDDITDISYCNNGQIWIRSLTQGSMRVEVEGATPEFVEKLAFQCSNVMGTTFNNAKPFLDAESTELRLNFVHQSIATNGIALVIRKTPAKIRLEKEKLLNEEYFTQDIHDLLIKCVQGHCNIMVAGETGSGKTEFVKYLASHTKTNEKIITIEDTLELHLDRIFPQRDIVAMKTNNVASYSDVLVTCMRQNPKWILLSEVRSAEAVSAVRNSISSGHNILSTIHADKASAIPYRLYSLMETDLDVHQFLTTIYRYVQLGVHIKAYYSKKHGKFHREVDEVTEFYVDDNNNPQSRVIYQKVFGKAPMMRRPSDHLIEYLNNQNIDIDDIISKLPSDMPFKEFEEEQKDEVVENNNLQEVEIKNPFIPEENNVSIEEQINQTEQVEQSVSEVQETQQEEIPMEQQVVVEQPQEETNEISALEIAMGEIQVSPEEQAEQEVQQEEIPMEQQVVVEQPQELQVAIPTVEQQTEIVVPQQQVVEQPVNMVVEQQPQVAEQVEKQTLVIPTFVSQPQQAVQPQEIPMEQQVVAEQPQVVEQSVNVVAEQQSQVVPSVIPQIPTIAKLDQE